MKPRSTPSNPKTTAKEHADFRKLAHRLAGSLADFDISGWESSEAAERWVEEQRMAELSGSPWLKELYGRFAPVREEAEAQGVSDKDINTGIDQVVSAVRKSRSVKTSICPASSCTRASVSSPTKRFFGFSGKEGDGG